MRSQSSLGELIHLLISSSTGRSEHIEHAALIGGLAGNLADQLANHAGALGDTLLIKGKQTRGKETIRVRRKESAEGRKGNKVRLRLATRVI